MTCRSVVALAVLLCVPAAYATVSRTAVSINGSDANSCTPASPCRNFAAALAQTSPGGEVIALDSGGFGPFTISQPVTVQAAPGVYAGITVPSGGTGVLVNATSGVVVIRGLSISGLSGASFGVYLPAGQAELHVEHCAITGTILGVSDWGAGATLFVHHTAIRDSTVGLAIDSIGPSSRKHLIDDSYIEASTATGILVDAYGDVTVRNSTVLASYYGMEARTGLSGQPSQSAHLVVENCLIAGGFNGISSQGASAVVTVSHSTITRNSNLGVEASSGGTLVSLTNNNLEDNNTAGSFSSTVALH